MKKTQLVGILNCTSDSYFEKGRYLDSSRAIEYGLHLFEQGADIVDIGGESTRPLLSKPISEHEEIKRVIPVIEGIRKKTTRPLSIDTFKPLVAKVALDAGVTMINDITGFTHPLMRQLASQRGIKIILMHMKGPPHSTPSPLYPRGVIVEIYEFFKKRVSLLLQEGVKESQIILDPGIGGGSFGKSPKHCLQIIKHLDSFQKLGYPLLIGLSRKSFLQNILNKEASEVLSTTLALNTMSTLKGVAYIRVHDVKEHREILTLLEYIRALE